MFVRIVQGRMFKNACGKNEFERNEFVKGESVYKGMICGREMEEKGERRRKVCVESVRENVL